MTESNAREAIRTALGAYLTPEQTSILVDEILAITKRVRTWCSECRKQVWVDVPDARAVTASLGELLTQAHGRPQGEQLEENDRIIFERIIYCEHCEPPPAH